MDKRILAALVAVAALFSFGLATAAVLGEETTLSGSTTCEVAGEQLFPDADSTDGHVTYLFGAYALLDSSGDIADQNSPQQLSEATYTEEVSFVPDQAGDYTLALSMFYATQHFVDGSWQTTGSGECSTEPNRFVVEATIPPPSIEAILDIIQALHQLWLNGIGPTGFPMDPSSNDFEQLALDYCQAKLRTEVPVCSNRNLWCDGENEILTVNWAEDGSSTNVFANCRDISTPDTVDVWSCAFDFETGDLNTLNPEFNTCFEGSLI